MKKCPDCNIEIQIEYAGVYNHPYIASHVIDGKVCVGSGRPGGAAVDA